MRAKESPLGSFFPYDTRFTGYESLTHVVLFKAIQRQRWEAEAAYVLRFLQFSDVNLSSIDDGSYLKVTYYFDDKGKAEKYHKNICTGAKNGSVTGVLSEKDGRWPTLTDARKD